MATPDSRIRVPVHEVKALDASGAGDTFCGSFLARYLEGDAPEQAARYANVAAALKCTGYGTVTPTPAGSMCNAHCHKPEPRTRLVAIRCCCYPSARWRAALATRSAS